MQVCMCAAGLTALPPHLLTPHAGVQRDPGPELHYQLGGHRGPGPCQAPGAGDGSVAHTQPSAVQGACMPWGYVLGAQLVTVCACRTACMRGEGGS